MRLNTTQVGLVQREFASSIRPMPCYCGRTKSCVHPRGCIFPRRSPFTHLWCRIPASSRHLELTAPTSSSWPWACPIGPIHHGRSDSGCWPTSFRGAVAGNLSLRRSTWWRCTYSLRAYPVLMQESFQVNLTAFDHLSANILPLGFSALSKPTEMLALHHETSFPRFDVSCGTIYRYITSRILYSSCNCFLTNS